MSDLYIWGTSNGQKVSATLEEVGFEYNVHLIDKGFQKFEWEPNKS